MLACRDSLLLDCVPLSQGSKEPECFVEGLTVVDECKPANATGSSLQQLLSAGMAVDGDDGSLCSLVPTSDKVRTCSGHHHEAVLRLQMLTGRCLNTPLDE